MDQSQARVKSETPNQVKREFDESSKSTLVVWSSAISMGSEFLRPTRSHAESPRCHGTCLIWREDEYSAVANFPGVDPELLSGPIKLGLGGGWISCQWIARPFVRRASALKIWWRLHTAIEAQYCFNCIALVVLSHIVLCKAVPRVATQIFTRHGRMQLQSKLNWSN